MTTTHKHPYSRLTCAEMQLVDNDCIPNSESVSDALCTIDALGLRAYGPGIDEQDPFFSGSQDYTAKDVLARITLMRQAQTMLKMGITPENINEIYRHDESGHAQELGLWYCDYCRVPSRIWHGKEDEDCHPENWIEDGALKPYESAEDE